MAQGEAKPRDDAMRVNRNLRVTVLPRGLRAPDAAIYLGISRSKFLALVQEGKLPKPKQLDGCKVWDRFALDDAFDDLDSDGGDNPWDSDL